LNTRRVNNSVKLAGRISYLKIFDKSAIMTIDTGPNKNGFHNNFPNTVCFEKVLPIVAKYQVGDYVKVDATMQGNKPNDKNPTRTIAVNHIGRVNPNAENYHTTNRFDFYGRLVKIEKIDDKHAKAKMCIYTGKQNYITVHFESENEDDLKSFCNIDSKSFIYTSGEIETKTSRNENGKREYHDKLSIRYFKIIR